MGKMETGTRIARQRRLWLYARYKICGALDLPLRDLVGQHILYPMRVRLGRSLIILPPSPSLTGFSTRARLGVWGMVQLVCFYFGRLILV